MTGSWSLKVFLGIAWGFNLLELRLKGALAPRAGGCSGAFVALISGSRYVTAALCLYRSLVAVGSTCPFVLVHDDRPAMRLRADDMRILTRAISKESLVPIIHDKSEAQK